MLSNQLSNLASKINKDLDISVSLGGGYSSSASIHMGEQTIEGRVTVVTQDSRGELEANKVNTGSGDPASEISWRAYRGQ